MPDPVISRDLDTRLNLRHAGQRYGVRRIDGNPRLDATGELADGEGALQVDQHRLLSDTLSRSIQTEDLTPYVENLDPWRVRIPRVGRTAWERIKKRWGARRAFIRQVVDSDFPLRTRLDILRSGRQLTSQELQEVHEDIEARRLDDFHCVQAERARVRIIRTLTRLGHCSSVEREGQRRIRAEVQIHYVEVNALYYRMFVDAATLPYGVSIMDIQGDAVCTDLSVACGHPVRSEIKKIDNNVIGLQYTVEIAATMGVPNLCKFSDMLPLLPASAPPLAFMTGYSEGKRLRYANLEELPHFLGGGSTMGGKSNMLHAMACCLISRNTPDELRLLLIDLKFDGIEMTRYKRTPHLIAAHDLAQPGQFIPEVPSGIATIPEQAIAALKWIKHEAKRRGSLFTKAEVQNLRQWNRRHPSRRLPYIVVINDELANLRLNKQFGAEAYDLLQEILSTARAAGFSFVTFTQSSNSRIVDEFIKVNLPGRICFSVPDAASSILFVGTGAAKDLTPAGRAIYNHGTERYLVQTPLIEASDIAEIVANAKLGNLTAHLSTRPIVAEEVIEWALHHNQSSLAFRDVFRHFGTDLQRIDYDSLVIFMKELDGHDYRVGDHVYQVLPGIGKRPRALIQLDQPGMEAAAGPLSPNPTPNTDDLPLRCAYCGTLVEEPDAVECERCRAPTPSPTT
jgi:hypothetical protein